MTASIQTADIGRASGSAPFKPFHRWDRNFFAAYVVLIWVGIAMGFGTDIVLHIQTKAAPYPLIVHVHAAAFMGWLVLFTAQVGLIRAGNQALHRKFGYAAIGLALAMLVIGPATAIVVDSLVFARKGTPPIFVSVQFADMLAFAGLTGAGVLLRNDASAHKRLMLLGVLYISDAGFSRGLGDGVTAVLGDNPVGFYFNLYLGNTALILGLGVYDLITRRRLHPVYAPALAYILAIQLSAVWLFYAPYWKPIALYLIGH